MGMRHEKSECWKAYSRGDGKRLGEWKRGARDEAGGEMLRERANEEGRGSLR